MPYNLLYVQTWIHGCMHIMYNYMYTCIYILMNIHPFIPSFQTLMSVVMEHTNAPKYVQTLMEASFVNVMMAIY